MTIALVTGAGRGIGRAVAIELSRRDVQLILLARTAPVQTEQLLTGAVLESLCLDLADPEAIVTACRLVLNQYGAPDVVINNAATIERRSVETTRVADWDRQLNVNLRAPFLISREILPAMRANGHGRIIHVASISATLGTAEAAAYCASKWGLVGFTKSLAEELRDSGVMTLAILPGSVDTDMLKGSGFAPRMAPEDVAKTIVHYALDAPMAHNGSVIEMFGV
jgi:NAD(P)-dependent dehydrogenase (short-subunit alcohol dehydrogenase family)